MKIEPKNIPDYIGDGMNLLKFLDKTKKDEKGKRENGIKDIYVPTFPNRIKNIKKIGFAPKCVMDCGASIGGWSYEVSKIFPGCQIIAIEPNSIVLPKTKKTLAGIDPEVIIEECALGAKEGESFLNIWDNDQTKMSGSSLKDHVQGEPKKKLKVKIDTLDSICDRNNLKPDLVKLDLQGGELEALKGGDAVLNASEVVIIEFGCLPAYIERTTPLDLMNLFYNYDYCLYDIIDLIYRPYDNALTGGDFIFAKNNSLLKKYKGYK